MPSPPNDISTNRLFVTRIRIRIRIRLPLSQIYVCPPRALTLIHANADIRPRRRLSPRSSSGAEAGTGCSSHSVTSSTGPALVNDTLSGRWEPARTRTAVRARLRPPFISRSS
ncbi:hypothetical protein GALMADRAFT_671780 [Galerina marginata CBS 339.88]|uniref:Uncharacterized protein n=1 Tax=Galerina marginata (strain CBS 339.88) TaxID=685588 RepID=A0A067TKS4_GALM3|nr:hypothetical protein GALMADRAFT_671780 [Galerina marginata CBS 339.88]